LHLKLWSC